MAMTNTDRAKGLALTAAKQLEQNYPGDDLVTAFLAGFATALVAVSAKLIEPTKETCEALGQQALTGRQIALLQRGEG